MIPYDDLVVALTAWRARQGLPVAQPAIVAAAAAAPAAPPPPARGAAAAPPRPAAPPAPARAPAPAQIIPEAGDFEDGSLVEDSYDSGEDYVMQLGGDPADSTEIGAAPEPPSSAKRGKRPDGW